MGTMMAMAICAAAGKPLKAVVDAEVVVAEGPRREVEVAAEGEMRLVVAWVVVVERVLGADAVLCGDPLLGGALLVGVEDDVKVTEPTLVEELLELSLMQKGDVVSWPMHV